MSDSSHADIARTHRHAMATRPTETDSWLNGYRDDVGLLLAENQRLRDDFRRIAELSGTWEQVAEAALRIARSHSGIVSSADAAVGEE